MWFRDVALGYFEFYFFFLSVQPFSLVLLAIVFLDGSVVAERRSRCVLLCVASVHRRSFVFLAFSVLDPSLLLTHIVVTTIVAVLMGSACFVQFALRVDFVIILSNAYVNVAE